MPVPPRLPNYAELPVDSKYPVKNAWGLFGQDDNVGMFNLQTPERIVAAARLVKKGAVFALNWEQTKPSPPLFRRGAIQHVFHRQLPFGHHGDDHLDNFYPQASSQWDGLSHVGDFELGFWGGLTNADLTSDPSRLGIDHWARRGIAGRAVLLDVARFRLGQGRPLDCAAADRVTVEDLEATRLAQGVEVAAGDVLLIRTGWVGWYERQNTTTRAELADLRTLRLPGLECSERMAEYLFDFHPSAVAADNPALESWPPPKITEPGGFLHHYLLGRFGIAIGEMFVLDALAEDCDRDGAYEGFLVSAPLNIPGGVGTPANALVIK